MKRRSEETQTLRGAENFRPAADPLPGGAGRPKSNQLETVCMCVQCIVIGPVGVCVCVCVFVGKGSDHLQLMVTTFTYKPSLVKIDARNFELSW